jgi:hypothetical protein
MQTNSAAKDMPANPSNTVAKHTEPLGSYNRYIQLLDHLILTLSPSGRYMHMIISNCTDISPAHSTNKQMCKCEFKNVTLHKRASKIHMELCAELKHVNWGEYCMLNKFAAKDSRAEDS